MPLRIWSYFEHGVVFLTRIVCPTDGKPDRFTPNVVHSVRTNILFVNLFFTTDYHRLIVKSSDDEAGILTINLSAVRTSLRDNKFQQ